MQTFLATLSKEIDTHRFLQKWAEEVPSPPSPKTSFSIHGRSVTATVQADELTGWDKQSFCNTLKMVVHKVDKQCEVLECILKAWQVAGDNKPSRRYYEEAKARAAAGPEDVVIPSDE